MTEISKPKRDKAKEIKLGEWDDGLREERTKGMGKPCVSVGT